MYNHWIQPLIQKIKNTITGTLFALIAFITISLVPCIFITYNANSLITQKIRLGNENFFSATSSSLDDAITSAVNQATSMIQTNSSDYYTLLRAESVSDSDTTIASYHLHNALKNNHFNTNFFSNVFLYFSKSNHIITTSGTYDADYFFESKYIFKDYPETYFSDIMKKNFNSLLCLPTAILSKTQSNSESVYVERAIPLAIHPTGSSASDALLVLLINEQQLNNTFHLLNPNQSCYVYLMDTDSNEILNQPTDFDYVHMLGLSQKEYKGNIGTSTQNYMNDTYHISWRSSAVSKLRYIFVEPQLLITKQLHSFLIWTFIIVFVSIFLILFLYHIITRRLQKNFSAMFHRMTQIISSGNNIVSSEKDVDIASLKEAVELLCIQYESNQPHLITSFINRLLQENLNESEIQEFCTRFRIFLPNDFFNLIVFRTNFQIPEQKNSESPTVHQEILGNLQIQLQKFGYVIPLHAHSDLVLFLSAPSRTELENISQKLEGKLNTLIENIPECVCAQSFYYQGLQQTYRCYHQALTLLEHHGIKDTKKIYRMEDILEASDVSLLPENKKKIQILSKHSSNECTSYIESLLSLYKKQNVSFSQYRIIILELIFLLQQILYENDIPFSCIFSENNVDLVAGTEQLLLPEHLDFLCLNAYSRLAQIRESSSSMNEAEKILLSYIETHLADINLTTLSEVTGKSQNYLSQYFKKHFGITFLDYVTRKKIDKAKDLLINTTLTCKAIGESLGYYDQNVFIRNFKKLETLTPNEYRKEYLIKNTL